MIASVAALLGDPARANILTTLMDGRALTVSELAGAAGVTIQTASGHLAKLEGAQLLCAEKQGRHRYFRLSGPDVAHVLEALMGLAQRTGATRVRTGPKDAALRTARICYDHIAGASGVALLETLFSRGLIAGETPIILTNSGTVFFTAFGINIAALEQARRPVCRHCLDWSERRNHLGGALGAALLAALTERAWIARDDGRVLRFTPQGRDGMKTVFQLAV